jgi:hypothetical protein
MWKDVLTDLKALRSFDPGRKVFGASEHEYELARVLSPAQVAEAEAQWGVTFPEAYRSFLLEVGAGGCGPYCGVFRLMKREGRWLWDGDGGEMTQDLAAPFRHTAAWNLEGHSIWDSKPSDSDSDALDEWQEAFDEVYFDEQWTEGAICLCHHGCALRSWLVVSGPERGHMWFDGLADREGLSPHATEKQARMTFFDWYSDWLTRASP